MQINAKKGIQDFVPQVKNSINLQTKQSLKCIQKIENAAPSKMQQAGFSAGDALILLSAFLTFKLLNKLIIFFENTNFAKKAKDLQKGLKYNLKLFANKSKTDSKNKDKLVTLLDKKKKSKEKSKILTNKKSNNRLSLKYPFNNITVLLPNSEIINMKDYPKIIKFNNTKPKNNKILNLLNKAKGALILGSLLLLGLLCMKQCVSYPSDDSPKDNKTDNIELNISSSTESTTNDTIDIDPEDTLPEIELIKNDSNG